MLFEDNLGFVGLNLPTLNPKKIDNSLVDVETGFNRGNMFKDLYKPYKKYDYAKLMPENDEKALLFQIMALSFAINDLELYLDLHPDDTELLKKFQSYVEMSIQKEMEYVKKYGPLEICDDKEGNKFTWLKSPWPWNDSGGVKYV